MAARAAWQRAAGVWRALPGEDKYVAVGAAAGIPASVGVGVVALAYTDDLVQSTVTGAIGGVTTTLAWPVVLPVAGLAAAIAVTSRTLR